MQALSHLGYTFLLIFLYSSFPGQKNRVRMPNFRLMLFHSFIHTIPVKLNSYTVFYFSLREVNQHCLRSSSGWVTTTRITTWMGDRVKAVTMGGSGGRDGFGILDHPPEIFSPCRPKQGIGYLDISQFVKIAFRGQCPRRALSPFQGENFFSLSLSPTT